MPSVAAQVARRLRFLSLLRASLILGAAYDAVFALVMVIAPEVPARLLGLPLPPLPAGSFYLTTLAILLGMLASLYLVAAADPERHPAIIAVAIGGRLLGGMAFLATAWRNPGLGGLYPLAAADLGFSAGHAGLWWPLRT
jgi:hypothetical protein